MVVTRAASMVSLSVDSSENAKVCRQVDSMVLSSAVVLAAWTGALLAVKRVSLWVAHRAVDWVLLWVGYLVEMLESMHTYKPF